MASGQMVGRLRVGLSVDQAQFQRGMAQARTGLQRFSGEVNRRLGALGNLPGVSSLQNALGSLGTSVGTALTAAAGAAVVALGGISTATINAATEIQNLSRMSNALPSEFQGWAAGARTVGIEQNKLADILKDMNDRVGDFISTGGGPMADFFEVIGPKVGVTADMFRKLSGPQALQLYVDSLQKANLNQQDMTFYMEAIASDSTLLLPLLRDGGKAMGDLARRAEDLGAVMSDKTVRSLAAMKLTLGEVGTVMRGVRDTIGAAFAPALTSLAETFVSLMTRGSGLRLIFDGLASVVGVLARFFASLVTILSGAVSALWELGAAGLRAADEFTGVSDAMRVMIANSPIGLMYRMVTGFSDLMKAAGGFGNALSLLGDLAGLVWQGIVDSSKAIPIGLNATWSKIKQEFFLFVADLQSGWASFLLGMSQGFASAGMDGAASTLVTAAEQTLGEMDKVRLKAADAFQDYSTNSAAAGQIITDAFAPAAQAWQNMNDMITQSSAEAEAALAGSGGSGGAGLAGAADKAGGSGSKAKEKLSELQKIMKSLREEAAKLKATMWMSATDAKVWENLTAAGVSADSAEGRDIESLTRAAEGMKELKSATEEWKGSLSDGFRELTKHGSSFSDVLSGLASKLADMMWSRGFDALWNGGLGKQVGGWFSKIGIGSNANGTNNWRGGWTELNERGAEIVNLPRGTQIIPHQLSKRMVEHQSDGGKLDVVVHVDESGNWQAKVESISGQVVAKSTPNIMRQTSAYMDNQRKRAG